MGGDIPDARKLLMDLTMAFSTIDRAALRETSYKKGLPIPKIHHIRQGHKNTQHMAIRNNRYSKKSTQ